MTSSSALTAAKTVIRWLRWAAVLALVCSALGELWNYGYFTLETLGSVLGVVYIFWSEKGNFRQRRRVYVP